MEKCSCLTWNREFLESMVRAQFLLLAKQKMRNYSKPSLKHYIFNKVFNCLKKQKCRSSHLFCCLLADIARVGRLSFTVCSSRNESCGTLGKSFPVEEIRNIFTNFCDNPRLTMMTEEQDIPDAVRKA